MSESSSVAEHEPKSPLLEEHDLGNGMVLAKIDIRRVKEQEINAHVMGKDKFERLVQNIKTRGTMESAAYCAWPNREGPLEIVSGHHRIRAARAAEIENVWVLVDTLPQTRSQIIAKQLAHNALVGVDDEKIIKELTALIDNVDDLLATGLPANLLPGPEGDAVTLYSPHADFGWKTVTFTFLPHQFENVDALLDALKGRQDILCAASDTLWKTFLEATAKYARFKDVKSASTAVALLTETALREVAAMEAEQAALEAKKLEAEG